MYISWAGIAWIMRPATSLCLREFHTPETYSVYFWCRKCVKRKVRRRQRCAGTKQKLNVFHTLPVSALCVIMCCWLGRQHKCLALPQNIIWKSLELFLLTQKEKEHNTKKLERRKNDDSLRKLWQNKRLPLMVDVEVAVSAGWMMLTRHSVSFYTFVSRCCV